MYSAARPSPALLLGFVEPEFAAREPEPRGWVPFHFAQGRAGRTVESHQVPPATVPSKAQPRRPGLSCRCTAATRYPTCSRRHGRESFGRSSDTSAPIPANLLLSALPSMELGAAQRSLARHGMPRADVEAAPRGTDRAAVGAAGSL